MPELGLFPLPIVLVPTERIPLHIFEPRYRELIDECVETGGEFGLVLATGDGAVHEIGTRASVHQVLEALDDGSMNIVVEGGERFRLLELTTGPLVHDRRRRAGDRRRRSGGGRRRRPGASSCSASSRTSRTATSTSRTATRRSSTSSSPRGSTSASTRSRSCSPRRSPRRRMERLVELLELALEAVRLEQTLRERAGQNGKVSPLDPERRPSVLGGDDDAGAAAARVARGGERPVRQHLDGVRAAEEEVAAAPADDVVAHRLEPVELRRVEAALAVDVRLVDVHARMVDRLRDAERRARRRSRSPA